MKRVIKRIITAVVIVLIVSAALKNPVLRLIYPDKYRDEVIAAADEYGIDPAMLFAVIKTESGFDPDAVSYLGARGLMQIMPETFEWIRYKLDEENDPDMTFDNMYNAEDNIRYGCFLLGYLTDTFGELSEVAAAYHAGSGSVSSWLEDSRYTQNGILTDIPNPDTAHYVDKITNAYDTYCRLYKK